ncbi:uncharacterized protein SPPG_04988 [Spizellomyces punctatus DAOM BR117]|uniref:Transmembrane protein 135 N-terminal domain-containing protein n=1 Tax=Spizellomyces punctatus (strain DAOM BR117) TaxID=645134 RepID=A0A0L0HDS8_SPIPD|nr:uncharacterized protein SPPG_04988 [Spizellomyces punctatus DAOM BR117]KNC99600.1 hypothetical protein SPPG_04988 [Spizellomyces punctatus DAOM BR117]|eukprot:XP_016607640.1 hypothetical protein SPPG_04988 [Spizellomyces punctatus DAOM BR117]
MVKQDDQIPYARINTAKLEGLSPAPLSASKIPGHMLRVGIRAGLLGFSIRAGIGFLLRLVRVAKGKATLVDSIRRTLTSKELRLFAYFFASFGAVWKGVNDTLRLLRGVDDKLNGFVAGACAGVSLAFEEKGRRVAIAQQFLVRGLQCVFSGLKARNLFHLPNGDSLIFALASAQIMYAYSLHPSTIPKSFYKFILTTGPIPERVLQYVRMNNAGDALDVGDVVQTIQKHHATVQAVDEVMRMGALPKAIPCTVLHPWTQACNLNSAWVFKKVFKKILPVYLTLTFVPMALLKLKEFIRQPVPLGRRALSNALRSSIFLSVFVSSYQWLICGQRNLIKLNFLSGDHKLAYWIIGALASLSIFIEDGKRRAELAMYVLPRGVDSLYRVLRHRDLVPKIKYFEIFMFSMGMGMIISFLQTEPQAMGGMLYRLLRRVNLAVEDKDRGQLPEVKKEYVEVKKETVERRLPTDKR